jgi:prepilin-type N-terminal cleavage/methylation domain-containing protein
MTRRREGARRPAAELAAWARGFTLTELLVVMGIIMVLAAAAVPAINAFRRGQRLDHAGKLVQSVLDTARRRAITLRARHVVVFYIDTTDTSGDITAVRHAIRIYQEPTGVKPAPGTPPGASLGYYEGGYPEDVPPTFLPQNIRFHQPVMECKIQQGEPDIRSEIFRRKLRGEKADTIAFRRDGTVEDRQDAKPIDPATGRNIFLPDEACYQVPDATRADVVLIETDNAGGEVRSKGKSRRALVDVNPLTGRSVAKTFDIGPIQFMDTAGQTGIGN